MEENEIMLEERYAVIELPAQAVDAEIRVTIYKDGELTSVKKIMDLDAIREAFKEAEDGYIPSDATFEITEKGREFLEKHGRQEV